MGSCRRTWTSRIRRSLEGCRFKPSFGLCLFDDGYSLDLFGFLIALPFMDRWRYEPHEMMDSWRVYYFERSVVLCWGRRTKFIHMPWQFTHKMWEVQLPDGTFALKSKSYEQPYDDGRWIETYPYRYTLRSGEIQDRQATVFVERGTWHWRWFKWLPLTFPRLVRTSIEVRFSDEVGERTGSWKGGCIGTGYELKPGESALGCLRRMERERQFN